MDNRCNTDRPVVAGAGEQLHDGGFYSHTSGHCHCCCYFRFYRGTQVLKLLKTHAGSAAEDPMTLQEIADHFIISRDRVRQIEEEALKKR